MVTAVLIVQAHIRLDLKIRVVMEEMQTQVH